jgi:hypothetical protein
VGKGSRAELDTSNVYLCGSVASDVAEGSKTGRLNMLIDIWTEKVITFRRNDWWRARLADALPAIKADLNAQIDARIGNKEVLTSSWMPPGANWEGTPYESIYQVAGQDETAAALIFGQIVWETFQERPENWYQQEAGEINGRLVKGRTYFMAGHKGGSW